MVCLLLEDWSVLRKSDGDESGDGDVVAGASGFGFDCGATAPSLLVFVGGVYWWKVWPPNRCAVRITLIERFRLCLDGEGFRGKCDEGGVLEEGVGG